MEIPFVLINQVQISVRRHANLQSYDPDDGVSLADLPSAEEAVASLDPSPPYLRCRHCKGRLLRGLQSSICVFCGRDVRNDVAPDPINFRNTIGYRWLLESLNLDGSEIVTSAVEANNMHRRNTPKDELPLSDLLDLEIKWPSESEKFGSRISSEKQVQSKSSLNLSGVTIENIFASKEKGAASNPSIEPLVPVNQIYTEERIEVHNNLNLFENAQPSKPAAPSTEDESDYSDSGWGPNFQSAPSGTANVELTSFDPFVGSIDVSTHMDEVFQASIDSSSDKKGGATIESSSMSSDWFANDPWNNSNSGSSGPSQEIKTSANVNIGNVVESVKSSLSTDVDWVQDGRWQSDKKKEPDSNADEGDDSFDDLNDFARSTSTLVPPSTWKQATMPAEGKTSKTNLFSSPNQSQDINFFDGLPQPDLFSSEFCSPNMSTEGNKMPSETSILDRTADSNAKVSGDSDHVQKGRDVSTTETTFKTRDVEMILSQRHDLSFMLESSLSIPPKQEGSNSLSQD